MKYQYHAQSPDFDSYFINGKQLEGQWGKDIFSFIEKTYDELYGYPDNLEIANHINDMLDSIK